MDITLYIVIKYTSHCIISSYFLLSQTVWCEIISNQIRSNQIKSNYGILLLSYYLILSYIILYDVIWCCFILYHLIWYEIILCLEVFLNISKLISYREMILLDNWKFVNQLSKESKKKQRILRNHGDPRSPHWLQTGTESLNYCFYISLIFNFHFL